jgi:hypothetical protein
MAIKMNKKGDPKDKEKSDTTRINQAKDKYAQNLGMKKEEVVDKYMEGAYGRGENLLKSTGGGKPNMQKNRKKGSTTSTAYGKEVKKYEKGTKGIKMSKKGKC